MIGFEREVEEMRRWFDSPRFAGLRRLYTAREVVEQRGTIRGDYAVARDAAEAFHARLRAALRGEEVHHHLRARTRPGQAVAMKRDGDRGHLPRRLGDERQGLRDEDPGPRSSRATR